MFQASSAHLQEDTVVHMQNMVLSLCKQVSGQVLLEHDLLDFFFLLALQPPMEVVFYSPVVGFSLLAYEVS